MRRTLALVVSAALLSVGAAVAGPGVATGAPSAPAVRPAAAAAATVHTATTSKPRFTTKPKAPYRGGQRITVTYKGLPPNITVLIAVCRAGTNLSRGAEAIGDCAPFAGPSSEFGRTDAHGNGKGKVTILKGALKATNWPGWTCGKSAKKKCVLIVSDLSAKHVAKKTLKYKS